MLNIFNLFLFLLFFWSFLMLSIGQFSWVYVGFGIFFSYFVSFLAFKLKLFDKKSELLYLSFNFYRHFVKKYFCSFFSSIALILSLAFGKKTIRPLIYKVKIADQEKFHPGLLIASFDMSSGLFCTQFKDDIFFVHALDEKYFEKFNLFKTLRFLPHINEDNLV